MMARSRFPWRPPTLTRRLLVAQMLLLTLLWSLLMAFASVDGADKAGTLNEVLVYDAVISITENLADAPARQQQSLLAIDRAVRAEFETGFVSELAPQLQVWQDERLVYRSQSTLSVIQGSRREGIETLHIGGTRWSMRTRLSPHSSTRVEMLAPNEPWIFFFTLNSRGYYLLPLMISLPFLLIPAWLSIRLALRPLSRVAREVAGRGPHDLTPLAYQPEHVDLAAIVDSVDALLLRVSQSARRERSFIADAAHELRTPLAAMRVNVEALQGRVGDPQQRQLLAGILNSCERAVRLVEQLLRLMRNDTPNGDPPRMLALGELLQERLASLSLLATGRDVEFELTAHANVAIVGHIETLTSMIDNLVDNAIKYSPPAGIVSVALEVDGDCAVLRVSDQGAGIDPELHQRVFDRFFRAPHQTQSGSGLGLSIARSAAQQHGGTITLSAVV